MTQPPSALDARAGEGKLAGQAHRPNVADEDTFSDSRDLKPEAEVADDPKTEGPVDDDWPGPINEPPPLFGS